MAAPSFPGFHVTGPVHHFVRANGRGDDSNIYYLGTAEVTPKVQHKPFYADTFNSIGGSMVPMFRSEQGEMVMVGTLFSRYSKGTYDVLLNVGADVNGRGERGRFSRGSAIFGVGSFELWLVYENATNPAFRSPGLELGYYFPQVDMGPRDDDFIGTDTQKLMIIFEAFPFWVPQASANQVTGFERSWQLFSKDDDAFPDAVLVPQ